MGGRGPVAFGLLLHHPGLWGLGEAPRWGKDTPLCPGCSQLCRGPGLELGCCSIPLSCPIPGQGAMGSQEVQKESPPRPAQILSLLFKSIMYNDQK